MLMRLRFVIVLLIVFGAVGLAGAQDEAPYPSQLIVQVTAAPEAPPEIEMTADGLTIFHVHPVGTVTGDLEGSFAQDITQVDPCDTCYEPNQLQPIAAFFTIETDEGTIEGYYVGAFFATEESNPDVYIKAQGQILSVTADYADLYLADVYYDGLVNFEEIDGELIPLGDSGPMVIAPR